MSYIHEAIWSDNCGNYSVGETLKFKFKYLLKDIVEKEKQDALKPIKEVWEKYKDKSNCQLSDEATDNCEIIDILYDVINDFRKAINTTLGEK